MIADWKERAEALVMRAAAAGYHGEEYDKVQDDALELVNMRLDSEFLRGKVWSTMTYACDACEHKETYELECGVEGPPLWRKDSTYIACAFSAGSCEKCGGVMSHTNFKDDANFEPRSPHARHVFRVPRSWPIYPTQGITDDGVIITARGESAFLSINLDALR